MSRSAEGDPARGAGVRLGVYQDGPFSQTEPGHEARLSPDPVDAPFLRFVTEVARDFDGLAVFARIAAHADRDDPLLLPAETEIVALPDYGDLRRLGSVVRAAAGTARAFWRGLGRVDVVWAFGPHPFQLVLVGLARLRQTPVVLGVRQDTPAYFRARMPSGRWRPLLLAVDALDYVHVWLARRLPVTVVGDANAERYGRRGRRVLAMQPSLVRAADVVDAPPVRDWAGAVSLLTVGRIDPEKNPLLLVEAMAELEHRAPGRFHLRWVGTGSRTDDVRALAAELGADRCIELVGYVPFGPELLELYRAAHAFVHVSLTEGAPQVLVEALASGTPIVATDVGGVRAALANGAAGLLVPPADPTAVVEAVLRLADDGSLQSSLVERGLELARARTLEAEAARVAEFIRGS